MRLGAAEHDAPLALARAALAAPGQARGMLAGLALHAHLVDVVDGRVLAGLVEPEPAVARADHAGRPRRLHIRVSPPVWAPRGRRALRSGAPRGE